MTGVPSARKIRTIGPDAPLHAVLDQRAAENPHGLALRFLTDGETSEITASFSELAGRARSCAAALTDAGLAGRPVLLALSPGIDFVSALFACWHAGAIAVPVYPPRGTRHRERFAAILADCGARHVIGSRKSGESGPSEFLDFDEMAGCAPLESFPDPPAGPCLLQYTSGSTASPKGVMISHHNLRAHYQSLACFRHLELRSVLSWLPPYHDMGLVLNILYAIEAGIPLTFFSPDQFIQRPVRWCGPSAAMARK
jgi:acyl-CoA synthetase (AMP-forming)/AMP-acid ligase II